MLKDLGNSNDNQQTHSFNPLALVTMQKYPCIMLTKHLVPVLLPNHSKLALISGLFDGHMKPVDIAIGSFLNPYPNERNHRTFQFLLDYPDTLNLKSRHEDLIRWMFVVYSSPLSLHRNQLFYRRFLRTRLRCLLLYWLLWAFFLFFTIFLLFTIFRFFTILFFTIMMLQRFCNFVFNYGLHNSLPTPLMTWCIFYQINKIIKDNSWFNYSKLMATFFQNEWVD